jgi:large repetitive protein
MTIIVLILASVMADAGSVTYTYDGLNRLTRAQYEDGTVIQYTYDGAGNQTALYLNATPPITTAFPPGGLYNSAKSVTLTCTDLSGGGCDKTYYCTGTDCEPTTQYSSPINISATTTLRFFSTDLTPHTETPVKTQVYTFDTTAPTGTITINSGAASTNSVNVTLTLSCSDSGGSGCSQIQFSNDGSSYSTPEVYVTTKAWILAAGDGNKTVYAKFKDAAGNWSIAYDDAILLDTQAPTGGSITINSGANCTSTTSVTLTLACNDGQGTGCSWMQFSNDGTIYSELEAYTTTKAWALPSTNGTKTVYAKFKDGAGNWLGPLSDTIVLNSPVIIMRTPNTFYSSLQSAYDAAATSGDTIACQSSLLTETLTVNRNIEVTLQGGYNCEFTSYTGNTTPLKGMIKTEVGGGKITIRNFVLEQ